MVMADSERAAAFKTPTRGQRSLVSRVSFAIRKRSTSERNGAISFVFWDAVCVCVGVFHLKFLLARFGFNILIFV